MGILEKMKTRMLDLSDQVDRLTRELEEAKTLIEKLKQEAKLWKGEDLGHKASLFRCYQAVGAQVGDWNGAKPVIDYVQRLEAENQSLKEQLRWRKWPEEKPMHGQELIHQTCTWTYLIDNDRESGHVINDGKYSEQFEDGDLWQPLPTEGEET